MSHKKKEVEDTDATEESVAEVAGERYESLEHTLPPTGAHPGPTVPEVHEFDKGYPKIQ